jgi:uncharacterized protein (TIGR03435 family)
MRTVLLLLTIAATAGAQPQAPALDAVSIKANRGVSRSSGIGPRPGGGINGTNTTLRALVRWAWDLNNLELTGGEAWTSQDRYDVIATTTGNPDLAQTRALVKTMLADRFTLVVRTERRSMPVYLLTVARADGRLGVSLRPSTVDCGKAFCGSLIDNDDSMKSTGITLDDFSKTIAGMAGRLIVNRTGLSGPFDLELRANTDPGATGAVAALPSLFTAVTEQLGLKLEAATADVDVLVIASAEKPTEN